jgi:hypothetical protein
VPVDRRLYSSANAPVGQRNPTGLNLGACVADSEDMRIAIAVILAGILGAAFVYHERRSALEHDLSAVATQLAERPVHVHCQGFTGDLVDVTPEAGTVRFDQNGRPADVTNLKRPVCSALHRFGHDVKTPAYACVIADASCPEKIVYDVFAVQTLAHESWHLRGNTNEALTECHALQTTAFAATLFGADEQTAQATATYALRHIYPYLPDEYRTPLCTDGGPMDLRPTDPHWP